MKTGIICEKGRLSVDIICAVSLIAVIFCVALMIANKYRVYKHSGDFESLFDNTMKVYSYVGEQQSENVSSMFNVLKLVPDGIEFKKEVFNDSFDTNIIVKNRNVKRKDGEIHYDYYMFLNFYDPYLGIMSVQPKLCHNFLNVIRKNSDSIEWVDIRQGVSVLNFKMYGRDYCDGKNCLSSLTTKNVNDICYYCTADTYCSIYVQLKTKQIKKPRKQKKVAKK